ncbi:Retrovirus-related Pol polyprotein from transposon TNT 1-94 [Gossypium australe]|uniref:Retrovirus-related Pol polyprotein from transposon TNT 1-94 n=1 Tax=Gossypium australe TaxID=47621 RepID=A0A5B6WFN0_9ROSI|nr:Retrovirus-related Pol polyprotein from transposon TNT 1-94 [Gossypium australe]
MTDLGEVDVILGVKVTKLEKRFALNQSHYIEKILKMFNSFDAFLVRTPYNSSMQLLKNKGNSVSQSEYAKNFRSLIVCLKYLKCTITWELEFFGYPTILEGYCDANRVSDNDEVSFISGYFLLWVEQQFLGSLPNKLVLFAT